MIGGSGYRAVSGLKSLGSPGDKGPVTEDEARVSDPIGVTTKLWRPSTQWMSDSHKRTLTLGPHWDQLKQSLSETIKSFTDKKVKKPVSRQVVFKLLGAQFVRANYPTYKQEPHTLEEPYMMPDVRDALLKEFRKELLTVVTKHLDKTNFKENPSYKAYQRAVTGAYSKRLDSEVNCMVSAAVERAVQMQSASGGFVGSMDSMTEADKELMATKMGEASKQARESGRIELLGQGLATLLLGNGFELSQDDIEQHVRLYGDTLALDDSDPFNDKSSRTHPADLLEFEDGGNLVLDPGTWSKRMDHNSRALLRALIGRCLPASLRKFLYKWRLFDSDDVEATNSVMKRNVAIHHLKDATKSALFTMISRTVPILFNGDLREYDSKETRNAVNVVLNQFFVTYGTQHASHIPLIVPLLCAFPREPLRGPVLVSMFNCLLTVLPGNGASRAGSLAVAREAVEHLERQDKDLHDFMVGLLEKAKAQQNELRSMNLTYRNLGEFREIATYLVPWVDNCFVGYLKRSATDFIWDQCFICGWQKQFPIFVADVIQAARKDLLTTKSAYELQNMITTSGRNVTTRSLRKLCRARAKDKGESNKPFRPKLGGFYDVPLLTRLHDAQPESTSVKRIQRLLAMVGGAEDLRRARDEEESNNIRKALEYLEQATVTCVRGDHMTLSTLLVEKHIAADAITSKSQSLLYVAAYNGHPKCVQTLLEHKAPIDVGDNTVGLSPLHGTIIGANSRLDHGLKDVSERYRFCLRYLLDAGADPNYPATRTIIRPREMIGADEYDKLRKDRTATIGKLAVCPPQSTPLHLATACAMLHGTRYYGSPELVLLLRRHGADVGKMNAESETPAGLVAQPSCPLAIKHALEVPKITDQDVDCINTIRQAAGIGAESKFAKAMSKAQKCGTRNYRVIINGTGGLEGGEAAKELPVLGKWEVAGATALSLACAKGHIKIVRALLDAGADPECGRPGPFTPLMTACRSLGSRGDPKNPPIIDLIKRLVKAGANANCRSAETGGTALHFVAMKGLEELYDHLVQKAKGNGTVADFRGHTPKSLLGEATGKATTGLGDVGKVPDMHQDTGKQGPSSSKKKVKKPAGPRETIDVTLSGKLIVQLTVPPRIKNFDQLVETRDLVMDCADNVEQLDKLSFEAVSLSKTGAQGAKDLVQDAVDKALTNKYKTIRDNRNVSFLKAKVKNNDGKPVLVKLRILENADDGPEEAFTRANIVVERLNLPTSAAAKLAKALVSYSAKKGKTDKVSFAACSTFPPRHKLTSYHEIRACLFIFIFFVCFFASPPALSFLIVHLSRPPRVELLPLFLFRRRKRNSNAIDEGV